MDLDFQYNKEDDEETDEDKDYRNIRERFIDQRRYEKY